MEVPVWSLVELRKHLGTAIKAGQPVVVTLNNDCRAVLVPIDGPYKASTSAPEQSITLALRVLQYASNPRRTTPAV